MRNAFILTFLCSVMLGCTQPPAQVADYGSSYKTEKSRLIHKENQQRQIAVQKGDTLYSLSRRYDADMRAVIDLNGLEPPYLLSIGQTMKLPVPRFYRVRKGDTLYGISRRYNVDLSELTKVNAIEAPYVIAKKQRIRIPYQSGTQIAKAPIVTPVVVAPTIAVTPKRTEPVRDAESDNSTTSPVVVTSKPRFASNQVAQQSQQKTIKPKVIAKKKTAAKPIKTTQSFISNNGKPYPFTWPVKGAVKETFGPQGSGVHNEGITIAAKRGTVVKAASDGKVVYTGSALKGYGNLVIIRHAQGWLTAYAHQDSVSVKRNQMVKRGETIGYVGDTGRAKSPQLHFAVRKGRDAKDPMQYLGS